MTRPTHISEAIRTMRTGAPFSIRYVSFDKRRKTGGLVKQVDKAILCQSKIPQPNGGSGKGSGKALPRTFNIEVMVGGNPTGVKKRIHYILVLRINNQEIHL